LKAFSFLAKVAFPSSLAVAAIAFTHVIFLASGLYAARQKVYFASLFFILYHCAFEIATMSASANTSNAPSKRGPRKESILELSKLMDATVRVKCLGGRELQGTLRGYDELVNLVLDDCEEYLRDPEDEEKITEKTRKLGLVVIRGTQVSLVSPQEGVEEISNPFLVGDDEEEE
jgi:U6 snRNA-associated Sm-like protein LSm7